MCHTKSFNNIHPRKRVCFRYITVIPCISGARGGAVVEALRYKPEGQGSIPNGVIGIFH
jgi:hypothetical protein